jgi:photosystem II stability/assembly factor-like uncharacterized protein
LATAGTGGGPNCLAKGPNGKLFLTTSLGEIWVSEDNAVNWSLIFDGSVISNAGLNAISFFDEVTGLAGGVGGVIVYTVNGGESWTESLVSTVDITTDIVSIEWTDESWTAATVDGKFYYVLIASNAVMNELTVPGTAGNTTVDMATDGCTIWYVYNRAAGINPGRVVYSINGGANWEIMSEITNTGFNAIAIAAGQPYIVGNGGTIVKATDLKR